MPYRVIALLLSPFFLWASWHEWGKPMGIIFLIMAVGYVPLGLCIFTLRVTIDAEGIRAEHVLQRKRIRFEDIVQAKLRTWTAEYVVHARDGTKIVFPTWLESTHYIMERCSSREPPET